MGTKMAKWTPEELQALAESVHLHLLLQRGGIAVPENSVEEAEFLQCGRDVLAGRRPASAGNVINASARFALRR